MNKSITYIAPHKTALTVSLVFALISLLMIMPMALMIGFMPATDPQGNPVSAGPFLLMAIFMPVFYFIFGYIFTVLAAWLYNKVARFTGGIQFATSE